MLSELIALLKYNYNRIDFIDEPVSLGFDCPLDLHCTYTRDQLLVAMDFMKPSTVREGVKWLPDKEIDVFFITLNKSDKDYSPTTMYQDYSINETLFHWQSQSTTNAEGIVEITLSHSGVNKPKIIFNKLYLHYQFTVNKFKFFPCQANHHHNNYNLMIRKKQYHT